MRLLKNQQDPCYLHEPQVDTITISAHDVNFKNFYFERNDELVFKENFQNPKKELSKIVLPSEAKPSVSGLVKSDYEIPKLIK